MKLAPARPALVLTTGMLVLTTVGSAGAPPQDPSLSITILIVDERLACKPDGYMNYSDRSATSQRCRVLTAEETKQWMEEGKLHEVMRVPPLPVPLGRLLPFVASYVELHPEIALNPARRRAAVFVFEWNEPQYSRVSLKRESSSPGTIPPSATEPHEMQGSRRWIYHERADALLPAYRVVWTLSVGEQQLRLRTWR